MKKLGIASIVLFCLSLVLPLPAKIKAISKQVSQIDEYRLMLKSRNINDRAKAVGYFAGLSKKEIDKNLMNEIIDLFEEETKRFKEANKSAKDYIYAIPQKIFPEDSEGVVFMEYLNNYFEIIGKSGNKKALSLLLEYGAAPKYFVGFGEEAVGPYLDALNKADTPSRTDYYINFLGYWLQDKKEGYSAFGEMREKIKKELIKRALSDKEYTGRVTAVHALSKVIDNDLFTVFEKIAAEDPFHFEEGMRMATDRPLPPGKKALRYPLREMARMELEKRRKK